MKNVLLKSIKIKKMFIVTIMILTQIIFVPKINTDAAQTVYFNIEKPGNTQGITFGKDNTIIYVLKASGNNLTIQLYYNKQLKEEYLLSGSENTHPNGIAYYNSYLYVATGENKIILIKLNENGSFNNSIICQMVDNDYQTLNKQAFSIASVGEGSFIVRTKTEGGKYNFGLYKFNKTQKIAREAYTFSISNVSEGYNTGQDIGYKSDSTGEYIFLVTSNKVKDMGNVATCLENRVVKYKLQKNNSGIYTGLSFSKVIDLNSPSSEYDLYEIESVTFSSSGRMYFTGNERANGNNVDKVRFY